MEPAKPKLCFADDVLTILKIYEKNPSGSIRLIKSDREMTMPAEDAKTYANFKMLLRMKHPEGAEIIKLKDFLLFQCDTDIDNTNLMMLYGRMKSSEEFGTAFGNGIICSRCIRAGMPDGERLLLQRCARCHAWHYCCKAAQVADWSEHKKSCKKPVPVAAPAPLLD